MNLPTALLIIDAQVGLFEGNERAVRSESVIANLNTAIEKANTLNMPIIFIQHDGPADSPFAPHSEGWQIHPALARSAADIVIRKTVGDSFYAPALNEHLKALGVQRLWIGGAATDFCIDTAVRTALSHDYEVTVIADGHSCRDRPVIKGETVIAHFNWVWSEMIEAPKTLRVQTVAELR